MAKKTRTPAPSTPDPWAWPTLSPTISMAPSNADYDIDVALDLFTTQFLEQFVDAKSRWEDIIAGILPRFYVDDFIRAFSACGRFLPERFVDDLFVCGVSGKLLQRRVACSSSMIELCLTKIASVCLFQTLLTDQVVS